MAWLARLLGFADKEPPGHQLDLSAGYWEVEGSSEAASFFRALEGWLPDDAILYFESTSLVRTTREFLTARAGPELCRIAKGTIWPGSKTFHVPATRSTLLDLAALMEHHAEPELTDHFHIYRNGKVLLQWYDAFDLPMLIDGAVDEARIKSLCQRLGVGYRRVQPE